MCQDFFNSAHKEIYRNLDSSFHSCKTTTLKISQYDSIKDQLHVLSLEYTLLNASHANELSL